MRRYLLLLALASASAFGQDNESLVGAGFRTRPHYDGADRRTTDLVPVLRYSRGPLFARTTHGVLEGGARIQPARGVHLGVQLAHEAGPLDDDPGASAGAHLEWTTRIGPAPVNVLARWRSHLESERGRALDLRITMGVYQGGGFRAGLFGQATWASEKHLLAYYDVRDSGLLVTSLGVLGSYDLSRRWLAVGSAELRRLGSEPAASRFVQERTNPYVTAGLAYRF